MANGKSGAEYISVFGATQAFAADGKAIALTPNTRDLLALLVAAGPAGLTTEQILDETNGGRASDTSKSKVRMDLSRLRKRVGEEALPMGSGRWRLAMKPTDVDYFRLVHSGNATDDLTEREILRLLRGVPFRESAHTPAIVAATLTATAARRSLIQVLSLAPLLLTPLVLDAMATLVRDDPFSDGLTTSVLTAHLRAGAAAQAASLLAEVERAYAQSPQTISPDIDPGVVRAIREPEQSRSRQPNLRAIASHSKSLPPLVGRDRELEKLRRWLAVDSAPLLITGVAGVGKSRLLEALRHMSSIDGWRTVVVHGQRSAQSSLGPWRVALPAIAPAISDFLTDVHSGDPLVARATFWDAVRDTIHADEEPAIVVIDDAQLLDSQSEDLAQFLVRTSAPEVRVVVCGRAPRGADDWHGLYSAADEAGALNLALNPLSVEALDELIANAQPSAGLTVRAQLARQIHEQSGGLPAIAKLLIDRFAADPTGGTTERSSATPLSAILAEMSDEAFDLALVLAVLGRGASWEDIMALVALDENKALEALTSLVRDGIGRIDDSESAAISLDHILFEEAVVELAADADIWRLHQMAAERSASVHERARHEYLAYPLVPSGTSTASLLRSGSDHVATGAYRESLSVFRRAQVRADGRPLPIRSLIEWASALDRTGFDGHRIRSEAVHRALRDNNQSTALEAALSGLPEAESSSGDTRRIELLHALDSTRMTEEERFDHALTLGRLLAAAGRLEDADPWLEKARLEAPSLRRLGDVARAQWMADAPRIGHRVRLESDFYTPFGGRGDAPVQHLIALDLLGAGRMDEALERRDQVAEMLRKEPSPFLGWHHRLFNATLALAAGDPQSAAALASKALDHGLTYGLKDAGPAWLAQVFATTWMQRGAAELVPAFDMAKTDTSESILARAAWSVALADAGQLEEATSMSEALIDEAMAHRSFTGVAALTLAARVLGNSSTKSEMTYETLSPLRGCLAVVGGGFTCIGPVDLALAFLAASSKRQDHIDAALNLVDDNEIVGWGIAVRLEIARSFGIAAFRGEASKMASGRGWVIDDLE